MKLPLALAAVLLLAGCSSAPTAAEACADVKASVDRIEDSVQLAAAADSKPSMRVHFDSVQASLAELGDTPIAHEEVSSASSTYVDRGQEWVQEARLALNEERNQLDVAQSAWLESRMDLGRACSW